jgi:hypothetical protein
MFSLPPSPDRIWGSPSPPMLLVLGARSQGIERLGGGGVKLTSAPSSAEVLYHTPSRCGA